MAKTGHQVFISFRGADVRKNFLSFLTDGLKRACVNYYVDTKETKGEVLDILLQRIQESRLVLIILSENYMQSNWCIKELRTTTKDITESRRKVIPIFYNVQVADVKDKWKVGEQAEGVEGEETVEEREKNVKEALMILTRHMGMRSDEYGTDCEFIEHIVKEVKKVLTSIEQEEKVKASVNTTVRSEGEKQEVSSLTGTNLQEKEKSLRQRKMLILGMAGIGKTTIAHKLFEEGKNKFHRRMFFDDIDKTSKEEGLTELRVRLLRKLLKKTDKTITEETTHESVETELLDSNVFLVLDNVSNKKQLEHLLGNRRWISQGSKVVIVTSDKSLVEDVVSDTYVVPGLNEKEGLECFCYHAFGDHKVHEGSFMKQSREFVDYARGNPLALKVLGPELRGRDTAHWESKLLQLAQSPSNVLNVSYDGLSQQQKEAFLDVTCFFRSENHRFVTALVDSEPDKGSSEIRDLADKFLIDITGGRVEMHNLLYTLGKKLASKQQKRLRNHHEIIRALKKKMGKSTINGIRGMFLDMSEVGTDTALSKEAFNGMDNLRYLKIYDSHFPQENEAGYKLHFSNGVKLPLQKIRYLHWLRFPGEELPQDFNPKNLIDLKLPYSKIKRLWDGVKDTSKLTWVDLSHSVNLSYLSGLLGSQNLRRLNLEGCKELKTLDARMENLTSLVLLNLRGCSSLVSLTEMNMESLKTLILSDCSNLEEFQIISEQLEALYLDGTSIKTLPPSMIKLQKLVLLNLKDCTKLATVPGCLGNMKALQEVILSGCKKMETFPDLQENMRRLRIFLLDGTSIKEVPKRLQNPGLSRWPHHGGVKGFPLLRHLSLRGNDKIQSLQPDIGDLYHLKYIDLKFCKNLAGSVVESFVGACFPGCEVHASLSHQAYGSVIVLPELSRHWSNNGTTGVVLCAVVSFTDYQDQNNHVLVKCTCEFKTSDGSLRQFSCMVGGNRPRTINSDHVFVGYTSWLQIKKQKEADDDDKKDYSCSDDDQASLRFEVIDSTRELVKNCQVIKCGFSFVNESDEAESFSWEVNRIHGEASEMEVINQQGETSTVSNNSTQGVLASRIIDNEEALRSQQRETRSIGNNNNDTNGALMLLHAYSDDSELTDGDESQRMKEINQQGDTISIGDVSMVSQDSEESDESEINEQDETNSCVSSDDQGNSYVQECGRVTENTSAQMIKPVGLLCLMISISAGAAFILGKRKR
uniref:TIR domain-containing protein n=1 Tax=Brassica oleracea var. oleracea TaxID=109376 RepID=A0A0D3AU84_BRAOL